MKDGFLEDGDIYQKGDEWEDAVPLIKENKIISIWKTIPEQWIGMKHDLKADNTIGRMKIRVRRGKI